MKQLAIDDYVVCIAGPFVGKRGIITEIDPDGISFIDFTGREIICSYAQLHKIESMDEQIVLCKCNWCGNKLPPDAFYKNKTNKCGHDYVCKECRKAASREYRKDKRFPDRQRTKRRKQRAALIAELLDLLEHDVFVDIDLCPEYHDDVDRITDIVTELKGE